MSAALAVAFAAGMVATVNPCGFAMLPAYLSYFIGIDEEAATSGRALRNALVVGGVVSFGFLVVFGLAGLVISTLSTTVASTWLPWLALAVGFGLVLLGVATLRGFAFKVRTVARTGGARRDLRGVLSFGVSYAIASLSCTLPVFLAVIATQFAARSVIEGAIIFGVYAAGMATVLMALTVVLALGKQTLVRRFRAVGNRMTQVSGVLLIVAGAWIVWFWATAISRGASALAGSSSFGFVENLSQAAINFVADNTLVVGLVLGAVVALAGFVAWKDRHSPGDVSMTSTPRSEKV